MHFTSDELARCISTKQSGIAHSVKLETIGCSPVKGPTGDDDGVLAAGVGVEMGIDVGGGVKAAAGEGVAEAVGAAVGEGVEAAVGEGVTEAVGFDVGEGMGGSVGEGIAEAVGVAVEEGVKAAVGEGVERGWGGCGWWRHCGGRYW